MAEFEPFEPFELMDKELLETCPECGGEGGREVSKPQRDDPYFAVWVPCGTCNQSGFV